MKNIVWLISLTLLFLFGIQSVNVPSLLEEEAGVYVLQNKQMTDQVYSLPSQLPDADKASVDVESLAGQYRVIGRCQRQLTVAYSFLSKGVTCRLVKSCLDTLLQSANHVYTSFPRPCWSVSSDHYVFGMRRILI